MSNIYWSKVLAAVTPFKDFQAAVDATVAIMQSGLPVARIEFLDEKMVDACNRYSKLNLDVAPTLFLEFHGSNNNIEAQGKLAGPSTALSPWRTMFTTTLAFVEETCKAFECLKFTFATEPDKRAALWKARHNAWYAAQALRPGSKVSRWHSDRHVMNACSFQGYSTDVCVPISALPGMIIFAKNELQRLNLLGYIEPFLFTTLGDEQTFYSLGQLSVMSAMETSMSSWLLIRRIPKRFIECMSIASHWRSKCFHLPYRWTSIGVFLLGSLCVSTEQWPVNTVSALGRRNYWSTNLVCKASIRWKRSNMHWIHWIFSILAKWSNASNGMIRTNKCISNSPIQHLFFFQIHR